MTESDFDWPVDLKFTEKAGNKLAYRISHGTRKPIVYLGGFHSNMNGEKAFAVFNFARDNDHSVICLDYSCHGDSEGDYRTATVSDWLADVIHVISENIDGEFYLCGSSMGAWISLLTALHFGDRVKGIVTIAAATDMTDRFIWQRCQDEHKHLLKTQGYFEWQSPHDDEPYLLTSELIEDGRKHLLLDREIPIECPVRLLHGTNDEEVVWQTSLDTLEKLESKDVTLKLFKDANHRLSEPDHLREIIKALKSVL
ncbi:MAG: alpha/beta hydrolase [Lentisphaeraceae bacterium]|nr:alpha/beta hydrolase [Lentisphaeraceae bacterium]